MQSFNDVWEKALLILQNDLNTTSYETWIKLLTPMKMENDVAYFCISTLFQKSIIDKKYKPAIEKAISDSIGFDVTIHVMLEEEAPPRFSEQAHKKSADTDRWIPDLTETDLQPFNAKSFLTFENFVVGKENKFAHAAAFAIANNPGQAYNPFFIYGHSGLGKTHLVNAIANELLKNNPELKILYVKGDEFTTELVEAIKLQKQRQFKDKYRRADVLLMDDVQYLNGDFVQEEMFNTFDALYENSKQIILTADRPPRELNHLEERLQSRFSMGLTTDVQPPEYETRVAIIKRKAELYNLRIPEDVVTLIAQRLKNNVRELEGAIKKLKAYHSLWGQAPSIALANDAIEAVNKDTKNSAISPSVIIDHVARYFNIPVDKLLSAKKTNDIVFPRQMAIYIIREMLGLSLPEIGKEIGGKNHTTVLYSIRKLEDAMRQDPKIAKIAAELIENIKKSY